MTSSGSYKKDIRRKCGKCGGWYREGSFCEGCSPTYKVEGFSDVPIPAKFKKLIKEGLWIDCSWHNDATPHWERPIAQNGTGSVWALELWIWSKEDFGDSAFVEGPGIRLKRLQLRITFDGMEETSLGVRHFESSRIDQILERAKVWEDEIIRLVKKDPTSKRSVILATPQEGGL